MKERKGIMGNSTGGSEQQLRRHKTDTNCDADSLYDGRVHVLGLWWKES